MKLTALLLLVLPALAYAQADSKSSELTERVSPQVYAVPSEGSWPRMMTDGTDPIVSAVWSPAPGSNWLAITIAPGGGLNTQVYVVRSDGTGLRRLTDGGQDNNAAARSTSSLRILVSARSRASPLTGASSG
jgi:hypothetical protein